MRVPLAGIVVDGSTQPRAGHDQDVIAEYANAMRAGNSFPAPVLYRDHDGTVRIGDGHRRVHAARAAGLTEND
jgi:ParB-like chromosome segregation protein Spo0J